jgi:hypothetical protein
MWPYIIYLLNIREEPHAKIGNETFLASKPVSEKNVQMKCSCAIIFRMQKNKIQTCEVADEQAQVCYTVVQRISLVITRLKTIIFLEHLLLHLRFQHEI